jgi:beta-lactamase regulating signal transducer with metallopeptidase domain
MNALSTLAAQSWVERLGFTLLHFLWQGALIAAAYAIVRRAAPAPRTRYAAASGSMLAMALAPLLTFLLIGPAAVPSAAGSAAASAAAATWNITGPAPGASTFGQSALPWVVAIWLAGVVVFTFRLTAGWAVAVRLRSAGSRPAPPEWQETLDRLIARLGVSRPVRLLVSPLVEVPIVVGWLRPIVLAPVGILAGLPSDQVEALLAHELAHIARHDYLVNVFQGIVEAVLFYHPVVWWISAQIRAERELCCDDLAVKASGDALTYARALAELESQRPVHVQAALAATGGSLRDRIRRLLDPSPAASHILPRPAIGIALAVLLVAGAGTALMRGSPQREPATVELSSVWTDTVKLGDMQRSVRGLGILLKGGAVTLRVAESQAKDIQPGQAVSIDFQGPTRYDIPGRVVQVGTEVFNGTVAVDAQITGQLPDKVPQPAMVDGRIDIERLNNVLYVGRPVFAAAESRVTIFRLEPDGKSAVRVPVQFGRTSVNTIEVRSGLQPGDQIILSDMSEFDGEGRIAIQGEPRRP